MFNSGKFNGPNYDNNIFNSIPFPLESQLYNEENDNNNDSTDAAKATEFNVQSAKEIKNKVMNKVNGKFFFYVNGELIFVDDYSNNAFEESKLNYYY